jgi:MFS family permease
VKRLHPVHPKYLVISAELLADLGNLFVALTLLDVLILNGEHALSNLVVLCVVQQLPSIFLSPLAGVWMDRLGVKKWLTMVNVSKCLLVGLFAFKSSAWVIFSAYLCFTIGSAFFHIGRLSLTPMLIPKGELISFNALNERISLGGSIFGPWLIGWIILKTGQGVALGLAGALFILSACAVCRLPRLVQAPEESSHHARGTGGFRAQLFKYGEPFRTGNNLKTYFFIFGFVLLGGGVLNIGLPILYKTNLGKSIADWGLILSGFQAGSCVATFLLPRWSSSFSHGTILSFTFLILGVAMAILGHLTTYVQIAMLMILFGCGFTLMHVFLESLIQQNSPSAHIGKTMSLLTAYRGACYLGTILASALVLRLWGPQPLLLAASLLMISASLVTGRTSG